MDEAREKEIKEVMNYACVKSDNEIYWSPVPKPEPLDLHEKCEQTKVCQETEGFKGGPHEGIDMCEDGCVWYNYRAALKAFEDGLVKFENQKEARDLIPWEHHGYNGKMLSTSIGTCVPIEVEGKVVEQCRVTMDAYSNNRPVGNWNDVKDDTIKSHICREYRKVFRITK